MQMNSVENMNHKSHPNTPYFNAKKSDFQTRFFGNICYCSADDWILFDQKNNRIPWNGYSYSDLRHFIIYKRCSFKLAN